MGIAIACPGCSKRYDLPDSTAGKTARCRQCGQVFKIPAPKVTLRSEAAFGPIGPEDGGLKPVDEDVSAKPSSFAGPAPRPSSQRPAAPTIDELRNQELYDFDEEEVAPGGEGDADANDSGEFGASVPPRTQPAARKPKKPAAEKNAALPLQFGPLPALIFFGGSAVLWLFLFAVVWPSMQGREGDAIAGLNLPNNVIGNLPGIPPEAREAMARARPGANGFPQLPPPDPFEYPAGQAPPAGQRGAIRADVLATHEQSMNELLGYFDQFAGIFDSIQDGNAAREAAQRIQDVSRQAQQATIRARALPPINNDESRELVTRIGPRARAAMDRLRASTQRLTAMPGLGASAIQLTHGVSLMTGGLEQALAMANNQPGGGQRPYIELFVNGVRDSDESQVIYEKLRTIVDDPRAPSIASIYIGGGQGASYRVCPVADPSEFARKINFGRASISGYQITVSGLKLDNADVAAYRKQKQDEENARKEQSIASTPSAPEDPKPPADADALTQSLFKLKSSNSHRQTEGLEELARVVPKTERRDEVVQAVVPLATGREHFVARAAVKALRNWANDEAINTLIHIVKVNDDHFIRADAMEVLAQLKAERAAEAIAARISDDWADAPKALRSIGAPAEPALIALLSDPDSNKRKHACEVLRDIGGATTFEAMSKLPADPDTFVLQAARDAMQSIAQRIGPAEVKRIQAEARKKK